jgi:hypothetical protein
MGSCIAYATKKGREFIETTQSEWAGKWDKKVMYYQVIGTCRTLTEKQVRKALNFAMTTWDLEIDIVFKPFWWGAPVAEPELTIDFENKVENGTFKDRPSVLAYAYFPAQGSVSGTVMFNDEYIWSLNGKPIKGKDAMAKGWIDNANPESNLKTFNLITVLIHELGHSLGLRHDVTGKGDGRDVMDAYYDGALDLSERDILRILLKYPARVYSEFTHYGRLKKWLARKKASF